MVCAGWLWLQLSTNWGGCPPAVTTVDESHLFPPLGLHLPRRTLPAAATRVLQRGRWIGMGTGMLLQGISAIPYAPRGKALECNVNTVQKYRHKYEILYHSYGHPKLRMNLTRCQLLLGWFYWLVVVSSSWTAEPCIHPGQWLTHCECRAVWLGTAGWSAGNG